LMMRFRSVIRNWSYSLRNLLSKRAGISNICEGWQIEYYSLQRLKRQGDYDDYYYPHDYYFFSVEEEHSGHEGHGRHEERC
jgi:hypothetical protein